jgi:hypothetical protein
VAAEFDGGGEVFGGHAMEAAFGGEQKMGVTFPVPLPALRKPPIRSAGRLPAEGPAASCRTPGLPRRTTRPPATSLRHPRAPGGRPDRARRPAGPPHKAGRHPGNQPAPALHISSDNLHLTALAGCLVGLAMSPGSGLLGSDWRIMICHLRRPIALEMNDPPGLRLPRFHAPALWGGRAGRHRAAPGARNARATRRVIRAPASGPLSGPGRATPRAGRAVSPPGRPPPGRGRGRSFPAGRPAGRRTARAPARRAAARG